MLRLSHFPVAAWVLATRRPNDVTCPEALAGYTARRIALANADGLFGGTRP